jgi:hypothetical protein
MWDSGVITADAFFCEEGSDWMSVLVLFEPVQAEPSKAVTNIIEEAEPAMSDETVANNADSSGLQTFMVMPAYGFQRLIALLVDSGVVALSIAGSYRLLEEMGIRSESILTAVGGIILIVFFSSRDVLGIGRFISRSDVVDENTGTRINNRRRFLRGVMQLVALPAPMYLAVAVGWLLQFVVGEGIAAISASACGSVGIAYLIRQMASGKGQAVWDLVAHSVVVRSRKNRMRAR